MKLLIIILCLLTGCASWSKQEKVAGVFFLAAHTANYYSTQGMLDKSNYELNPVLGKYPSDKKVAVYFSLTGAGALIVAHFWKEARQWILWGYGGVNAAWVIHDRGLD